MDKGPDAFRTISEVADDLDLPQHVLRFWETRFSPIRPLKRAGGRRYYRPDDVDLLKGIRHLLYGQGYTIKGVQRILRENGPRFVQAVGRGELVAAQAEPSEEADEPYGSAPGEMGPGPDAERHEPVPRPGWGDPIPSEPRLGPSDLERLRAVLDELRDCARALDAVRSR